MDRKWWTLIAVCIGTFMLLIDVTIVNVALPDIQTSLKSSFSDLQWVVDAYSLMLAALLLTSGSLADLFGRRRLFVIGLSVFTVSSLLSGLATTPLFLNLARGAQGVGGAAMFSTSLALLASSFRGRERGMAFGVWGAITGLAVAIGPVVGGGLTTGFGWRWIFLVNVPIGVIGVLVTLLKVEESRQPGARHPDWIGALTFSGALAALVYALIQGENKGWGSTEIVACLVGAAVLLLLFLIAELVQKAPMFDLSLFRNPTFSGGSIVAFSMSAGMFALLLYLTLYLQDVLGYSALHTGLRLLFLSGGILLTSTIAGRLTTRVPIRLLIAPGLALIGGGLLLMRGLNAQSGWQHLVPGFIVSGAGVGLVNPPLASTAVGVVAPERAGMASGINSTFRQVGIATGIAGLGAIFSHSVRTKIVGLLAGSGIAQAQAHTVAANVAQGSGVGAAIAGAPPASRPAVIQAVRVAFVGGLNEIFLIAAVLSFAAAALSLVLIRNKDFEASAAYQGSGRPTADPATPAAAVEPESPEAEAEVASDATGAVDESADGSLPPAGDQPDGIPAPASPGESVERAAEVAWPYAESAEPAVEAANSAEPAVEAADAAEPAVEVAMPYAESAEPAVEAADAAEPAVEAADAAEPAVEAADAAEPGGVSGAPPADVPGEPFAAVATADWVGPPPPAALPGPSDDPSARSEPTESPAPNGAAPAGSGDGVSGGGGGGPVVEPSIAGHSYAVALAADQAAADCSSYIERIRARQREAELAGAGDPAQDGLAESLRAAAERAAALTARLDRLTEERRALVGALRDDARAVDEHTRAAREQTEQAARRGERAAETRREIYGVIAALAALTDEARAEDSTHGSATPAPDPGIPVRDPRPTNGALGARLTD
jgi:EmrB/QacA subfamily drug resistance transporter